MKVEIIGQGYSQNIEPEILSTLSQPKILRRLPAFSRLGLCAAVKALESASLFPPPSEMGLVIGSWFGPQKDSFDYMDSLLNDGPPLSMPMAFANSVGNSAAGLIAHILQIQGPAFTVNNESKSFINVIQIGTTLVSTGRVSGCLAGCIEEQDKRLSRMLGYSIQPYSYFLALKDADA